MLQRQAQAVERERIRRRRPSSVPSSKGFARRSTREWRAPTLRRIASRQAPQHGSTAISLGPDSRISAAVFSAQLMQTSARSIPQPVQLQLDL
jgi:hypothetical protein